MSRGLGSSGAWRRCAFVCSCYVTLHILADTVAESGGSSKVLAFWRCVLCRAVCCRWRQYCVECTGSLPTSEVKRRRARFVLGGASPGKTSGCCQLLCLASRRSAWILVLVPRFLLFVNLRVCCSQLRFALHCGVCVLPVQWLLLFCAVCCCWRPYRVECTGSLPTSEVKRRRARLVLGWGTAREDLRVLSAFSPRRCARPLLRGPRARCRRRVGVGNGAPGSKSNGRAATEKHKGEGRPESSGSARPGM